MADLTRTNWTAGDRPTATDWNNIGLDIRTAGADRNMGGHRVTNCADILDPTGASLVHRYAAASSFTPLSPAQNLTAGVAASVTLNPFPAGIVAGSAGQHSLRITDATGGNETVLLSAVNLGAGTVTFTPSANHGSGQWSIGSATAGIQEALFSAPQYSIVEIAAGLHDIYGPIHRPGLVNLKGAGLTTVLVQHGSFDVVVVAGGTSGDIYASVSSMSIVHPGGEAAPTAGAGIHWIAQGNGSITNIQMHGLYDGIVQENSPLLRIQDCIISVRHCGVWYKQNGFVANNGGIVTGVQINLVDAPAGTGVAVQIEPQTSSIIWSGFHTTGGAIGINFAGVAIPGVPSSINEVMFGDGIFDMYSIVGVNIASTSNTNVIDIHDCWITGMDAAYGILSQSTAPFKNVKLRNNRIITGLTPLIIKGGSGWLIDGNELNLYGVSGGYGIQFTAAPDGSPVTNCRILNNTIGYNYDDQSPSGTAPDIGISTDTAAHANNLIRGNRIRGGIGAIGWSASGAGNVIESNVGIDDTFPSVASATTIAAPAYSNFFVTGTATITTINGGWKGRRLHLMKSDAGSVTVGGGGNVPGAHTLAQHGSLDLVYDGTNWR